MGDLNVRLATNKQDLNKFTKHLLRDMQALERMLHEGWFNEDPLHIGAEQEICLVDSLYKPAPMNMTLLEQLDDSFVTELAKFNIEGNLPPLPFTGNCFSQMEQNINNILNDLRKVCYEHDTEFVLAGILPTIRKFDLELDNLTPLKRYEALVKAVNKLRGDVYELRIRGIDELNIKHDSAMLEACNTSFQVHLQVKPSEFVDKYNTARH